MSDSEIRKIGDRFRADMQKLGLGVRIRAGDGPWRTIAEEPCGKLMIGGRCIRPKGHEVDECWVVEPQKRRKDNG